MKSTVFTVSEITKDNCTVLHGVYSNVQSAIEYAQELAEELYLEEDSNPERFSFGRKYTVAVWMGESVHDESIHVEEVPLLD